MDIDQIRNYTTLVDHFSLEEQDLLGQVPSMPDETVVNEFKLIELSDLFMEYDSDAEALEMKIVEKSQEFLANGRAHEAWKCLLALNI